MDPIYWPFKRGGSLTRTPKVPPRDIHAERIEQLARIFPTGSDTQYLGTTMEVLSHYTWAPGYPSGCSASPRLTLRYKDTLGVVRETELGYAQAIALTRRLGNVDVEEI